MKCRKAYLIINPRGPNPKRKGNLIVAGETSKKKTKESKPVAVRIDHNTTLFRLTREALPAA
jgi:hypothetical protein